MKFALKAEQVKAGIYWKTLSHFLGAKLTPVGYKKKVNTPLSQHLSLIPTLHLLESHKTLWNTSFHSTAENTVVFITAQKYWSGDSKNGAKVQAVPHFT